jgi:YVTN family beta-propeller protein
MSHPRSIFIVAALATTLAGRPGLALDAVDGYVFVPNRGSADVAVIDSRTDRLVARLPVGRVPHQVVVSDVAGKLVASNTADDTISIVELSSLETRTLELDHEPEHMELAPDGRLLAIGNIAADVASGAIISEIEVAEPAALAGTEGPGAEFQGIIDVTRTPDGRLGFAAHGDGNRLAVIDLRTGQLRKNLQLGELPWRAYGTADGRYMLVPNNGDRTLSVISTATLEVAATLPSAADVTGVNTGWFETTAFALSRAENKAVVYDLQAMARVGEIAFPGTPETGVTTPDGTRLYVALSDTDQVAVIDVRERRLIATIDDVGDEPWGATMVGALNYCH